MTEPTHPRATAIMELLRARNSISSRQILEPIRRHRFMPDDVIICTYPRSGTSWLQQLCDLLRRERPEEPLPPMSAAVPFLDLAWTGDPDLDAARTAGPRLFKSHLPASDAPAGPRYIYGVRDPVDVLVSYYNFQQGEIFDPLHVDLEAYARAVFIDPVGPWGTWWAHVHGWWRRSAADDVLWVSYESLVDDPIAVAHAVARWMGTTCRLEAAQLSRAAGRERWSDSAPGGWLDPLANAMGVPTLTARGPVRAPEERMVRRRDVPPALEAALADRWVDSIGARLGFADYDALERRVTARLRAARPVR